MQWSSREQLRNEASVHLSSQGPGDAAGPGRPYDQHGKH